MYHDLKQGMSRISKIAVTGMLIFISLQSSAQQFELFYGKRETIPFKLVKNLIIIPVYINHEGPFNFVLDSGVGLFIISDPALIDSLSIKALRSIKITGFGEGADLSAYITPSIMVKIGYSINGTMPAAILKRDVFDLSSYAGMPIHGLLGYEFFNSFIVRIDYTSNTLTAYRTETAYIPRKGTKIPITIEENKPYIRTEISVDPAKKILAKLIIDTGAGHPVSLETIDGEPFEEPGQTIKANLGVGLNGAINGYLGRISTIKIGKFELKNVIAAFPNYNDVAAKLSAVTRNGNIGNSILKRFGVVFDYSRECIYLSPSLKFREPFEHDMSGLELVASGKDFNRIFIARVETGSAAYDIGLKDGDELISINFKQTTDMTIEDINNLFNSRNDRSFILEVLPEGMHERQRVILTLKRRI